MCGQCTHESPVLQSIVWLTHKPKIPAVWEAHRLLRTIWRLLQKCAICDKYAVLKWKEPWYCFCGSVTWRILWLWHLAIVSIIVFVVRMFTHCWVVLFPAITGRLVIWKDYKRVFWRMGAFSAYCWVLNNLRCDDVTDGDPERNSLRAVLT